MPADSVPAVEKKDDSEKKFHVVVASVQTKKKACEIRDKLLHDYARKNGVAIKGDIPIGVSPRSVDAWIDPDLFNTHVQAGAPPDDFSATGQNWGFPTYNWEGMEKKNYS